jgi:transmembrane regulatory protein ToxS
MPIARLNAFNSAIACILISTCFSLWLYWGSDFKTEQLLTSREWQSRIVTLVEYGFDQAAQPKQWRRVDINSNVKYLPNNTYIRVSVIKVYSEIDDTSSNIDISENGTWTMSDGYLLISPSKFKDISANQSRDFSQDQLDIVTQFFKMDAQQSRRIDVVNQNTLLLTGLTHDSVALYGHDLP